MAKRRDHYAILQVNHAASEAEIKAAYSRLSGLYDPAVSRMPQGSARWAEIVKAYEILSDKQRRSAYDRKLAWRRGGLTRGPETKLPRFVTRPYTLAVAAIGLGVIALAALLLSPVLGGGDEEVVGQPTGTVTPEGQTPRPPAPGRPPGIAAGEAVTTASGLQYIDIRPGTGATPQTGQVVVMEYSGWLQSTGTLFDSSFLPDRTPLEFPLGQGRVIQGWDEGIATMQVGGKRRLVIPPALAYGEEGRGAVPPNAALIFDVELLQVR